MSQTLLPRRCLLKYLSFLYAYSSNGRREIPIFSLLYLQQKRRKFLRSHWHYWKYTSKTVNSLLIGAPSLPKDHDEPDCFNFSMGHFNRHYCSKAPDWKKGKWKMSTLRTTLQIWNAAWLFYLVLLFQRIKTRDQKAAQILRGKKRPGTLATCTETLFRQIRNDTFPRHVI